jgi:hypothetical protein
LGTGYDDASLAELIDDTSDRPAAEHEKKPDLDQAIQLRPNREYVVVMCADDEGEEWEQLKQALKLKPVRRGGYKPGSPFDMVGTQRVIYAADLIERLGKC